MSPGAAAGGGGREGAVCVVALAATAVWNLFARQKTKVWTRVPFSPSRIPLGITARPLDHTTYQSRECNAFRIPYPCPALIVLTRKLFYCDSG